MKYFVSQLAKFIGTVFCLTVLVCQAAAQTGPGGVGDFNSNQLWLDANESVSAGDGAKVGSFLDKSGHGYHFSQPLTTNQPTFLLNGPNGQPALHFDRTAAYQYLENVTTPLRQLTSNSNTIFTVSRATSGSLNNNPGNVGIYACVFCPVGYHAGMIYSGYPAADNLSLLQYDNGLQYYIQSKPITQGTWQLATLSNKETASGLEMKGFVNGENTGTSLSQKQMFDFSVVRIGVGNATGDFAWPFNGDISEIIGYNKRLNEAERIIVENYLSAKYNLSISNDFYANTTYTQDVQGIGTTDGTSANKNTKCNASKELSLTEVGSSLNATNEFVLCGHNTFENANSAANVPTGISNRWERIWYVEKSAGSVVDVKFTFRTRAATGYAKLCLLYRSGTSGGFVQVTDGTVPIQPVYEAGGKDVSFTVPNGTLPGAGLNTGYYTLGFVPAVVTTSEKQTGPGGVGDMTSNKLWLHADELIAIGTHNKVYTLMDKSGNGNSFGQTNVNNQPTLLTKALNGWPVIHFDRTNGYQYFENSSTSVNQLASNSNTLFAVAKANSGGISGSANGIGVASCIICPVGYHGGMQFYGYPATQKITMSTYDNSLLGYTASKSISQGSWVLGTLLNDNSTTGFELQGFINGSEIGRASSPKPMYSHTTTRIGSALNAGDYAWPLNGDIAEIIEYNRVLNNGERTVVENYLAAKYNLSVSNDYYSNNEYILDVQGIGTTDGTNLNKNAKCNSSKELSLSEINGSLNAPGEFLFCAHNATANSNLAADVPAGVTNRWERVWYLEKSANSAIDVKFTFRTSQISGYSKLCLLFRATTTGPFLQVSDGVSFIQPIMEPSGEEVSFNIPNSSVAGNGLVTGYYTLGFVPSVNASTELQTGPGGVGDPTSNRIWLDATVQSITSNGAKLSAFADKSGNGIHFIQTSIANQPTYLENSSSGKPAIHFDRTNANQFFENSTSALSMLTSNSNTFFAVAKPAAGGINNNPNGVGMNGCVFCPVGYHAGIQIGGYPTAQNVSIIGYDASLLGMGRSTAILQNEWLLASYSNKENTAGFELEAFVNGKNIGIGASAKQMFNFTTTRIGAAMKEGDYAWPFSGDIAELIGYNRVLNNAERVVVENYLAAKYNLSILNDYYSNSEYTINVQGIGTTDGTTLHKNSSCNASQELSMSELGASLNSPGEFLFSGYKSITNATLTTDLPTGVTNRWERVWYLEKSQGSTINAKLSFKLTSLVGYSGVCLLYRETVSGPFVQVKSGADVLAPRYETNGTVSFDLINGVAPGNGLNTGYYTIGFLTGISVTNDNDLNEPGSLRYAILQANANPDPSTITFLIGNAYSKTIKVTSPLPVISYPVTIDATTQPGYQALDELTHVTVTQDAQNTQGKGFQIGVAGKGSVFKGLKISSFSTFGILNQAENVKFLDSKVQ